MDRFRTRSTLIAALIFFGGSLLTACSIPAPTITTGPFTQVSRLEKELRRGVSTKMDVQRVFGVPKGFGAALFPTDPKPREVWYYEDIEVIGLKSEQDGVIRATMRQQILNVFFKDGIFDGFMWFSNAMVATGE